MKHLGFKRVVWLAALLVVAYLLAGPSFMDLWAYWRWKQIPCHVGASGRYFFEVRDRPYASTRRDFWQLKYNNDPNPGATRFEPDATCWVNDADPPDSVLFLDAHKNWSSGLGRLFASGFLLACIGGILHFGLKRQRSAGG